MVATEDEPRSSAPSRIPIVGIGASAGGLEAMRQLFAQVPSNSGMAFVVIQHLDPRRPSMLSSVLGTDMEMPVLDVTDGTAVEPNHVYVIPSDADLGLREGTLVLIDREPGRGLHLPIDTFFAALARDRPGCAIGVVLSGSGSDGTEGLRAIRAAGGITFAQDPASAQFRSMPESAIAAGVVDFHDVPAGIGEQLRRVGHHPYLVLPSSTEGVGSSLSSSEEEQLATIMAALLRYAKIDFKDYKRSTIMRRIGRRMALRSSESLAAYAKLVVEDSEEALALAQDVFIHVTSFFRDHGAFTVLEQEIVPRIIERKGDGDVVRVWVPGCSTGQEAYSIAMCFLEHLERKGRSIAIKIFGSDVSQDSITVARMGLYSEQELAGVAPERRSRCFERTDGAYRVHRRIREVCVFARHDLARDPPFARLDLISCRNVLIYFDNELQRRIIPMLHHSLDDHGYLFLGRSESIGTFGGLFTPVDGRHRFFIKVGESPRIEHRMVPGDTTKHPLVLRSLVPRRVPSREVQRQADHLLLARYAPPGAVINEQLEVVQFRGRTGAFLEPPPGQPQMNILRMAREGLVGLLHEAIEEAKSKSVTALRQGVRVSGNGVPRTIDLEVIPLASVNETERYFLVLFDEVEAREAGDREPTGKAWSAPSEGSTAEELRRLESELAATRDYLQVALAEHQLTTQELAAANEEMVAANEELQATNEELESAKEELQSTNEELTTVNDELRNRNQELDLVAADLGGVLESIDVPVVIVDHDLRIRRFTPMAREISWILPADVGRPIEEIKLKLDVDDLVERIHDVMTTGRENEWEIQTREGNWRRLRIRPYHTTSHRPDGAILSFVDVDVLKRALQDAERARDYSRGVVETVPIPLLVLDASMCIVSANHAFCRGFELDPWMVEGKGLFDLTAGAWDGSGLREVLERLVADHAPLRGVEVEIALPKSGRRLLSLNGSPIPREQGSLAVVALEDITTRRQLEESEREARLGAEQANRAKDLFLATLSHELRTPLSTILMSWEILESVGQGDDRARRATASIGRAAANLNKLIDELLDISRIVSGKLLLEFQDVELAVVVRDALEVARPSAAAKDLELVVDIHESAGLVRGDPSRLQQVVANLLGNAVKFTPRGGRITLHLEAVNGHAELVVSDTGIGVHPDLLPHLFDRFVQAEDTMSRAHGGLGLGLAIVRHLVRVHGGTVEAESPGLGKGTTLRVVLPLLLGETELDTPNAPRALATDIQGIRVLLIEDDDDARAVFATVLGELGADVRTASSVAEGLAAIDEELPHAILCDIAMPVEDGYGFIRKLRSRDPEHGGTIPVAAFTALAAREDRERTLGAGFQMHLTKPIDGASLGAAVGALVREDSSGAPS
ncbi:CheR family methyltransferase [Paraliomyxa miuraensis]|uniref:CheR family methyltransferase n=1 Tax=Paraliomyxa miuraensis TaxID=376150 RepID=UPI0022536732|nr:CheR family methyltransferase [Paraliomyxa miuraensis]MCX4240050.1 ATP-binding protein [Paraliomyxa miuraensis]